MPVVARKKSIPSETKLSCKRVAGTLPVLAESVRLKATAIAKSHKDSRKFLIEAGIITKSGNLTSKYK